MVLEGAPFARLPQERKAPPGNAMLQQLHDEGQELKISLISSYMWSLSVSLCQLLSLSQPLGLWQVVQHS